MYDYKIRVISRMRKAGFTLIELIVFMVIIAIAAALLLPVLFSLKYAGNLPDRTVALGLAQSRMELIMERRFVLGFQGVSDPCSDTTPPATCAVPSGYAVSATIANNWDGDSNYKIITVSVMGDAQATLTALVAAYE